MSVTDIINGMNNALIDDGGANYVKLHEGVAVAMSVFSYIFGICIVVLLIGIPIIVTLELLYINTPTMRSAEDKWLKSNSSMKKVLSVCLRDAKRAIEAADTLNTGRSANYEYLRIKFKSVLIAFVIIGIALGAGDAIIYYLTDVICRVIDSLF